MRPSRWHAAYLRNFPTAASRRALEITVFWLIIVAALITRVWGLQQPHAMIFDETYYVKDAWSLWNHGYETQWPKDADQELLNGNAYGYLETSSYVVHPPLGKWVMGAGMAFFGPSNTFAWRIMVALAGVVMVALVWLIAKRLFASFAIAAFAALLMTFSGNGIVMSRVALLDNLVAMFALLGVFFMLKDRDWHRREMRSILSLKTLPEREAMRLGPVLWFRPWLWAAAVAFGCATATKWSGGYFLAAFCVYIVFDDLVLRHRFRFRLAELGSLRQALATFAMTVPVALAVYLTSWLGWFITSGGYDRNWANEHASEVSGPLSLLPKSMQSFVTYQREVAKFHLGLNSDHPYKSAPLEWLWERRPTLMYIKRDQIGQNGCGAQNGCTSGILQAENPVLWYLGILSAIVVLGIAIAMLFNRSRLWQSGFILFGFVGGYLPWIITSSRSSVYNFYTIAFTPYVVLSLAMVMWLLWRRRPSGRVLDRPWLFTVDTGRIVVTATLVVILAVSVFFMPIWTGLQLSNDEWLWRMWLPTWYS